MGISRGSRHHLFKGLRLAVCIRSPLSTTRRSSRPLRTHAPCLPLSPSAPLNVPDPQFDDSLNLYKLAKHDDSAPNEAVEAILNSRGVHEVDSLRPGEEEIESATTARTNRVRVLRQDSLKPHF